MMNQVILVGRLYDMQIDNNLVTLTLRVPRPFKNENGEYDNDEVTCVYKNNQNFDFREVVNIQDIIGIRGRLANENGNLKINAEKITFLSSKTQSVSDYE